MTKGKKKKKQLAAAAADSVMELRSNRFVFYRKSVIACERFR